MTQPRICADIHGAATIELVEAKGNSARWWNVLVNGYEVATIFHDRETGCTLDIKPLGEA